VTDLNVIDVVNGVTTLDAAHRYAGNGPEGQVAPHEVAHLKAGATADR
jgi:hypothetical protein